MYIVKQLALLAYYKRLDFESELKNVTKGVTL